MRERGLPRQEVLPEVDIVAEGVASKRRNRTAVDRFHVMQNLNNALAVPSQARAIARASRPSACKARRTLQRQADADTKKRLKGFRSRCDCLNIGNAFRGF